jgi:hypothetical protein
MSAAQSRAVLCKCNAVCLTCDVGLWCLRGNWSYNLMVVIWLWWSGRRRHATEFWHDCCEDLQLGKQRFTKLNALGLA